TNYKIWVRSNCGNGDYGTWIGSQVFQTPCESAATIYEDFDNSLSLPACWHKVGNDAGTMDVVTSTLNGSAHALQLVSPSGGNAIYIATSPISTYAAPGYRIRFKYRAN